jgi:hypothetical protein
LSKKKKKKKKKKITLLVIPLRSISSAGSQSMHRLLTYATATSMSLGHRTLDGPAGLGAAGACIGLATHPYLPFLASLSMSGAIYIWAPVRRETWSSFAPGFREIDDNVEYIEREGELDDATDGVPAAARAAADERAAKRRRAEAEDAEVDILSIVPSIHDALAPAVCAPLPATDAKTKAKASTGTGTDTGTGTGTNTGESRDPPRQLPPAMLGRAAPPAAAADVSGMVAAFREGDGAAAGLELGRMKAVATRLVAGAAATARQ